MQRHKIVPRNKWQEQVEALGFGFHSTKVPYWDESACYTFTMNEILAIEKATADLWDMCLGAVQYIIDNNLYQQMGIAQEWASYIEKTWNEDHPAIYGRFDFAYNNGVLKLLEFNADTPTSLFEAGIVQWFWLQDFDKAKDQFNSIHEKLIDYWKYLKPYLHAGAPLHFACVKLSLEDLTNTEYLRDCAIQAGLDTQLLYIDDIGWDGSKQVFVDMEEQTIKNIFKLYPWEWLANEHFAPHILSTASQMFWIEPSWKMLLSNKAILPILWELYPDCDYLLPAYFELGDMHSYVKKPFFSREGANIQIVHNHTLMAESGGHYSNEKHVYQEYFPLPEFNGCKPVIGSWVIGQEPAGIGIRETASLITDNQSRFIPHFIE